MRERARLQLSRRQIADRCGVGVDVVKRWERGDATPSTQQFKRLVTMMVRLAPSTTGEITEAYASARLKLLQAQAREKVSHAELVALNERHGMNIKATIDARKEEADALALLDLALSEPEQ